LRNGRQGGDDVRGERDIVEANYGQIVRNAHSGAPGCAQEPDGRHIVVAKDGGGRLSQGLESRECPLAPVCAAVPGQHQAGILRDARRVERLPVARLPLHAVVVSRGRGHVRDPPVAEAHQVLRSQAPAAPVVYRYGTSRGGSLAGVVVDQHDRYLLRLEPLEIQRPHAR